jgi:hypothetical protein
LIKPLKTPGLAWLPTNGSTTKRLDERVLTMLILSRKARLTITSYGFIRRGVNNYDDTPQRCVQKRGRTKQAPIDEIGAKNIEQPDAATTGRRRRVYLMISAVGGTFCQARFRFGGEEN